MRALARKAARQALFFAAPLAASLLSTVARADENTRLPLAPHGSLCRAGRHPRRRPRPRTMRPFSRRRRTWSACRSGRSRRIPSAGSTAALSGRSFTGSSSPTSKPDRRLPIRVRIDTGYESITRGGGQEADPGIKYWLQQGRFLLRVTPTWSDGKYFVQAQAEMVANRDQTQTQPIQADVDDIWVKFGQWKAWDLQVGRYEAWEVYHFGMGMDLFTLERNGATDAVYTVPTIYGLTYAFYRPNGIGAAALHLYPTKNLRFELSTQEGNEESQNGLAARPVLIYDVGWMKLKGGWEYKVETPQNNGAQGSLKQQGFGGSLQFVVDPVLEFGASGAYGWQREIDAGGEVSTTASFETYSVGGFANLRLAEGLIFGGGYNYTYLVDQHFDNAPGYMRNEKYDHTQTFAALQYRPNQGHEFLRQGRRSVRTRQVRSHLRLAHLQRRDVQLRVFASSTSFESDRISKRRRNRRGSRTRPDQ